MGPAAKIRTVEFSGKAEDFAAWRMKFTALMETMNLRDVLTGESRCPVKEEGSSEEEVESVHEWKRKKTSIYSQLVLSRCDHLEENSGV